MIRNPLVRLASVEAWRRKSRFLLLTLAVAFLLLLLLFLDTLSNALVHSISDAIGNQRSDVLVYQRSARRNLEASRLDPAAVARLGALPGVGRAGGLGVGTFTAPDSSGTARNVTVIGYTPAGPGAPADPRAPRLAGREGAMDAGNAGKFPVGTEVRFEPSGFTVRVAGTARNAGFLAQPTLWLPLDTYVELLAATYPRAPALPINAIAVVGAQGTSAPALAARINAEFPDLEALTRADAVRSIPGIAAIQASFGLIEGATAVIVVVVSGFFFLIFTVQKMKSLAAMRAIGATSGTLGRTLLAQIAGTVVVAGLVAAGLLFLLLRSMPQALPVSIGWATVAGITGAVMIGSVAAGLVSVRRLSRMDPVALLAGQEAR